MKKNKFLDKDTIIFISVIMVIMIVCSLMALYGYFKFKERCRQQQKYESEQEEMEKEIEKIRLENYKIIDKWYPNKLIFTDKDILEMEIYSYRDSELCLDFPDFQGIGLYSIFISGSPSIDIPEDLTNYNHGCILISGVSIYERNKWAKYRFIFKFPHGNPTDLIEFRVRDWTYNINFTNFSITSVYSGEY